MMPAWIPVHDPRSAHSTSTSFITLQKSTDINSFPEGFQVENRECLSSKRTASLVTHIKRRKITQMHEAAFYEGTSLMYQGQFSLATPFWPEMPGLSLLWLPGPFLLLSGVCRGHSYSAVTSLPGRTQKWYYNINWCPLSHFSPNSWGLPGTGQRRWDFSWWNWANVKPFEQNSYLLLGLLKIIQEQSDELLVLHDLILSNGRLEPFLKFHFF